MSRFALCLIVLLFPGAAVAADDLPLAPAVECTPRAGLPNFVARAEKGESLKVAYLGGSITAQPGWRIKSLELLKTTFPKATLTEINAAIGGTGSDLGVFRLKQDVLDRQPDLLFVEFAVNDGAAAPEQIWRCMEGIVRQTWKARPECDICFVYTLVDNMAGTIAGGRFQRSASAMEKIADHYGIPTVHMGLEAVKLATQKKLVWKGKLPKTDAEKAEAGDVIAFSPDGVHPFPETGHELYRAAIARSLPAIQSASKGPGAHTLAEPFRPDNYERAQLLSITQASLSDGFVKPDAATDRLAKSFANRLPDLHRADQPGQKLTFKFKGTRCAIYDIIGPDCGQVTVTLDDRQPIVVPRFDAYCTYHRLATMVIGTELPDVVHTVTIEVHPDQPDKAAILARRNEKIDKPERFDGRAFLPGAILLVGELQK
jgi:hypothetical protein